MRSASLALVAISAVCFGQDAPKSFTLKEAVGYAIQNSPVIEGAQSEVRMAMALASGARSDLGPKFSANGFAATGNNSTIAGSASGVDPTAWMLLPTGSFLDGNLTLMMPLFSPRLRTALDSSYALIRASQGDLLEAKAELEFQVTLAFDKVLLAKETVMSEEAKVVSTTELVRTTKALVEAGKSIDAAVQRTEAELARAQRSLTSAKNEKAKSLLDLQALMGSSVSTPIELVGDLDASWPKVDLLTQIAIALKFRGAVQSAEAKLASARSEEKGAGNKGLPQVSGFAMGDATNRKDMEGVSVGLNVSVPLFDGGKIRSEVALAKASVTKARARLQQVKLDVEKEVRQSWLDSQTALSNAVSAEASLKSSESAYEVVALRVQAGKSIMLEQLDALEVLSRSRSELAQARFDQAVALAMLKRSIGAQS